MSTSDEQQQSGFGVVMHPGDRLVLVYSQSLDMVTTERIKQRFRERAPELLEPLIIGGVHQVIIVRAGEKD